MYSVEQQFYIPQVVVPNNMNNNQNNLQQVNNMQNTGIQNNVPQMVNQTQPQKMKGHQQQQQQQQPASGKKPKGRMSNYTYFVQMCREEHRKKHPNESVNFTEFSKKCAERWKQMTDNEKKRFADMAIKDKARYDMEMASYTPPAGEGSRKRRKKDPNAPKRPLSAFFLFCADERPAVKAIYPNYSVGEAAKELGERWNKVSAEAKSKYEAMVQNDKIRYDKDLAQYKATLCV